MKKILFFLMILAIGTLSSCSKSDSVSNTTTTGTANLPLKATQYIETNYPDASIIYAVTMRSSAAAFIVTLNTTEELAFTSVGDYLGDGINYHGNGHPGDSIHGDTIHFDSIPGGGGGHHGGGHHGGGHHGIPVDSLPAAIKDYITANYAGYTIRHAEYDSLCPEGAVMEIMIFLPGSEPLKLYFDGSYNFLFSGTRILYSTVPTAVSAFITANYGGYTVCNRVTLLTLPDNSLQYIIYLRNGQSHKEVRLKEDATLICES